MRRPIVSRLPHRSIERYPSSDYRAIGAIEPSACRAVHGDSAPAPPLCAVVVDAHVSNTREALARRERLGAGDIPPDYQRLHGIGALVGEDRLDVGVMT